MTIHTVKPGETVTSIAALYSVPPERIIADNFLSSPDTLSPGQALIILFPAITYTVRKGDTLNSIANRFGVTLMSLWQNNPLLDGESYIIPGQVINILYTEPKMGRIVTTGFAYPETDTQTLKRTLPYLSRLNVFTYGISENGSLIPTNDSTLLELAKEYKTSPILVLSSRTEEGTFNAERMRNILDDDVKRDRLTDEILNTVKSKGYDGVEADFEYLGDNYAEKYASFISELNKRLESEGYILTVDLAPKTSDNQPGSLYSGIDYEELGEAAQNSFLMTYEWGYRYSEPMAISPEDKVRDVVEYAVEKIDSEKILLGIPNYGYVWKLPYVEGESVAQSLSNTEAVQIANEFGSIIEYNEAEASPHYTFSLESNNEKADYEVWFEDARTVKGAMELIMDYGMLGMGVWNIRRYFPQLWAIVNSMYEIIKNE